MQLHGSICALVTPFDACEQLDLHALDRLLDWHLASGTHGLVLAGSTGEAALLDDDEYRLLIAHSVLRMAGRMPIIAGIGSPSTRKTLDYARIAAEAGADAVLAVTPYYVRPTQHGLIAHYLHLAVESVLPIILYNVPGRTGCDLLPNTVAALAAHPNIIGIKEASAEPERMAALLMLQSANFAVLSGDDPTALHAMNAGAKGTISVAANVAPRAFALMCESALSAHPATHMAAVELNTKLRGLYAVLGLESNPIPAKWALHRLGHIDAIHRLPLTPLSAQHHDAIDECLAALASIDAAPAS
ncbi:MAG: 4-hydroxy-tetrahydrodipicolinate synthase [Rhodanobacteraceae bacterium]|nr:4-hydroxy-tetrahydrodipicolinate synthase [Rhodanobacteraceae bacterium]MBK7044429.1 4-hydroxy-tetrahydrodipicolinate synthase [Rhodanobacteraceae bacterium]MBP9154506.1 4-hydroxy-tetrahydrodipicolinate synthase [Xanthomonadales bacterium]